jgi:hypothetical protein
VHRMCLISISFRRGCARADAVRARTARGVCRARLDGLVADRGACGEHGVVQ